MLPKCINWLSSCHGMKLMHREDLENWNVSEPSSIRGANAAAPANRKGLVIFAVHIKMTICN